MYRTLLKNAIGSVTRDMTCLIMKHSRVYIIPDGPPVSSHYCAESKATYIVMRDDSNEYANDKTFIPLAARCKFGENQKII